MPYDSFKRKMTVTAIAVIFLAGVHNLFFGNGAFPDGRDRYIEVKAGMSAKEISEILENEGVITVSWLFSSAAKVSGYEKKISTGLYHFKESIGVIEAVRRIGKGDFGIEMIKITFPEGFEKRQIADRLEARLPFFNKEKFLSLTANDEGYLFPDTYFFLPGITEERIREMLLLTFEKKYAEALEESETERTKEEIVTMASILEGEVKTLADKKIVSGILWKRMSIGMPLQVDASLTYERGKTSAELSTKDLEENSPYNTYTNQGLPPTPIGNPGLDSLIAALNPESSPYLYFLTDEDNIVRYARNFEEHKANKAKYIK